MKLTIGKPVEVEKAQLNAYKLIVSNEHGDADATTDREFIFEEKETPALIAFLEFLDKVHFSNSEYVAEEYEALWPKFEVLGDDMLEMDCIYTGRGDYAIPSLKSLTWFDLSGVEHEVTVTKD